PRPRQPSSSARAGEELIPARRARVPQAAANVLNLVMFVSNRPTGAGITLSMQDRAAFAPISRRFLSSVLGAARFGRRKAGYLRRSPRRHSARSTHHGRSRVFDGAMTEDIAGARRAYAEELRFGARVRSPALVAAFASVPRERFLGPGPWRVKS